MGGGQQHLTIIHAFAVAVVRADGLGQQLGVLLGNAVACEGV